MEVQGPHNEKAATKVTKHLRTMILAAALGTAGIGVVGTVAAPSASAATISILGITVTTPTPVTPSHTAPAPPAQTVTVVSTGPSTSTIDEGWDVLRLNPW